MPTLKDLLPALKDKAGTEGSYGGSLEEVPRIPTGIFELDLTIGGGIPRGRMTEIFGPEGAGKTNLALGVIREAQRLEPKKKQAFIDVEGTWDPNWAMRMGVDVNKVFVIRPIFAEQVSDAMQLFLTASDINCIVIDSIAAMTSKDVAELDSTKNFYGGETKVIKRMTQKTVIELNKLRNAGTLAPAVIWINQIRANFDAGLYGNPEKTPGGWSPRFAYSLRLRTYSAKEMLANISKTMPVRLNTTISVKKYKVPVTALQCKYDLIVFAHKDLKVGEVDSWHTVEKFMRASGALIQLPKGKGWKLIDEEFKTLKQARDRYRDDLQLKRVLEQGIIEGAIAANGFVMEAGDKSGDEDAEDNPDIVIDANTGEILSEAA